MRSREMRSIPDIPSPSWLKSRDTEGPPVGSAGLRRHTYVLAPNIDTTFLATNRRADITIAIF